MINWTTVQSTAFPRPYISLYRMQCQGVHLCICCTHSLVLASDNRNADALFVRGLCLYYDDNIEKAQQHFKHVLKMNPDHEKARETFKVRLAFDRFLHIIILRIYLSRDTRSPTCTYVIDTHYSPPQTFLHW